jgi:hypothetical protein
MILALSRGDGAKCITKLEFSDAVCIETVPKLKRFWRSHCVCAFTSFISSREHSEIVLLRKEI